VLAKKGVGGMQGIEDSVVGNATGRGAGIQNGTKVG